MATLAADKARAYEAAGTPRYNEVPIIASDTVYAGAAVGESSSTGTGRPLVAGDNFLGFAVEQCANESGAAAAKSIKILDRGLVWLTVTNGDNINDLNDIVYASDDDTFTMASTSNSAIGKVARYDSTRTNKVLVYFESTSNKSI